MNIRIKRILSGFIPKNPAVIVAVMFVIVVSMIIIGASQKEVTILDGMAKSKVVTFKGTVREVLEQNKIELNAKDKISPKIESVIKDGDKISIRRAVPVTVMIDGKEMQFLTAEETIEDVLAAEGIKYDKVDKVYPQLDTAVSDDMQIKIVRVTEKEITEKHVLTFAQEVQQRTDWEVGVEQRVRDGQNGEKETKIKITYEDGVETKKEVVEEKIVKPAISQLIAVGMLDTRLISRGESIQFKKMLVMKATSYTDDIACTGQNGGTTRTGTKPRRIPGGGQWSTVAVDPRVIPLGSKLWVEGYGFAIAEDTGGAVKGNIIDLFFTQGSEEYADWSTRRTKVYLLK